MISYLVIMVAGGLLVTLQIISFIFICLVHNRKNVNRGMFVIINLYSSLELLAIMRLNSSNTKLLALVIILIYRDTYLPDNVDILQRK